MLKILLKRQLYELNRSFFYDPKKGKSRSKFASAAFIVLYALLMVCVLGGMFAFCAYQLANPLRAENIRDEVEIFDACHKLIHVGIVRNIGDEFFAGQGVLPNGSAVHKYFACIKLKDSDAAFECCCFACAVSTKQTERFSTLCRERYALKDFFLAKGFVNVF